MRYEDSMKGVANQIIKEQQRASKIKNNPEEFHWHDEYLSLIHIYEPRDIVFSKMRPALRKVAVMNTNEGGYVSSECTVFTVRNDSDGKPLVEPEILSALLRSDFVYGQIMSCVTGIGDVYKRQEASFLA